MDNVRKQGKIFANNKISKLVKELGDRIVKLKYLLSKKQNRKLIDN